MRRTTLIISLFMLLNSAPALCEESPCGAFDPDCSRRLSRILQGIQLGPVELEGGVRFGEGEGNGAVRFAVTGAQADVRPGDVRVAVFEAIYLPDAGGMRLRFTLADSDVLFFCKDEEDGSTHLPGSGFIRYGCRKDASIGLGATVAEIQWDAEDNRVGARWAELDFVLNFLSNGHDVSFLKQRLLAFLGASAETVWNSGKADSTARLNMGITGMLRSENNRWEIRGYAGFRPSVTDWDDWAIEARSQVLRHLLVSPQKKIMFDFGLDARYSRWSMPGHSIGAFASGRDQDSFYVGAMFGVNLWLLGGS